MLEFEELGMDEACSEFGNKELFEEISMKNMLRETDSKITALNIMDIIISKVLNNTRLREMDALQLKRKTLTEDISKLRMNRVHEALSSMRMHQSEPTPKKRMGGGRISIRGKNSPIKVYKNNFHHQKLNPITPSRPNLKSHNKSNKHPLPPTEIIKPAKFLLLRKNEAGAEAPSWQPCSPSSMRGSRTTTAASGATTTSPSLRTLRTSPPPEPELGVTPRPSEMSRCKRRGPTISSPPWGTPPASESEHAPPPPSPCAARLDHQSEMVDCRFPSKLSKQKSWLREFRNVPPERGEGLKTPTISKVIFEAPNPGHPPVEKKIYSTHKILENKVMKNFLEKRNSPQPMRCVLPPPTKTTRKLPPPSKNQRKTKIENKEKVTLENFKFTRNVSERKFAKNEESKFTVKFTEQANQSKLSFKEKINLFSEQAPNLDQKIYNTVNSEVSKFSLSGPSRTDSHGRLRTGEEI